MAEQLRMNSLSRYSGFWFVVLLAFSLSVLLFDSGTEPPPRYLAKPVGYWIHQCLARDQNPDQHESALVALNQIGRPATEMLSKLIQRRERTLERWYRPLYDRFPDAITQHLPVPEDVPRMRRRAVEILGELGAQAEPVVPQISRLLDDADLQLRDCAIRSLGKIGGHAAAAVPALCHALGNSSLRAFAASTLGEIGPAAKDAVPYLLSALDDRRFFVRWHAAQALWKVDPSQCKRIVPILTEGLDNPILESHLSARTLIEIGPDAREAVPKLRQALRKADKYDRAKAAEALGRIGWDARLAVPELLNILSDPEPYVRVHAAEAIGRISPDRTGIKAVLHENLDSSDPFIRYVAARGLCNLLACADSLFPVLGDLVHDSNPAPFTSPTIMFIPSLRFRRGKANPQFRCGNLASATPVFLSKVRKRWRFDAWNVHVR